LRLQQELEDFDVERYLGDTMAVQEDELYIEAMRMEPHWSHQWQRYLQLLSNKSAGDVIENAGVQDGFDGFTESENEIMTKLPRKVRCVD
jgi:hypothetical protein